MYRRLYFLLPNASLTENVISELIATGMNSRHIHVHASKEENAKNLPNFLNKKHLLLSKKIENIFWRSDLAIFFIALLVLALSLYWSSYVLSGIAVIVMAASFLLGDYFVENIPKVHLDEFKDALAHNEILLMVDVPRKEMPQVESLVHRHHPAAVPGGASWTIEALGI